MRIHEFLWPQDRIARHGVLPEEVEEACFGQPMRKKRGLPDTDSIEELAKFWDSHDLTDFDEELVEVRRPVFTRRKSTVMTLRLSPKEADVVRRLAKSRGMGRTSLIQQWVREKLRKEAASR